LANGLRRLDAIRNRPNLRGVVQHPALDAAENGPIATGALTSLHVPEARRFRSYSGGAEVPNRIRR